MHHSNPRGGEKASKSRFASNRLFAQARDGRSQSCILRRRRKVEVGRSERRGKKMKEEKVCFDESERERERDGEKRAGERGTEEEGDSGWNRVRLRQRLALFISVLIRPSRGGKQKVVPRRCWDCLRSRSPRSQPGGRERERKKCPSRGTNTRKLILV